MIRDALIQVDYYLKTPQWGQIQGQRLLATARLMRTDARQWKWKIAER
jgi:hypothetical protein